MSVYDTDDRGASAPPASGRRGNQEGRAAAASSNPRPLITAGVFLGLGLGGFVDGIVFHQILQFHGMISADYPKDTLANVQANMVWDGIFHAATWMLTATGVWLLFRAGKRALAGDAAWSPRILFGSMVLGWGIFNFVEGLIDHHILHLHHVVEALGPSVYDWLFLASGVAMILGGWAIIRTAPLLARGPRGRPAPV